MLVRWRVFVPTQILFERLRSRFKTYSEDAIKIFWFERGRSNQHTLKPTQLFCCQTTFELSDS